jgi:integrase
MARKKAVQDPPSRGKKNVNKNLPVGVVEKDIKDEAGKVIERKWYVRVRYRENGKRHAAWRECVRGSRTDAKEVREVLMAELKEHGAESMLHSQDDFGALADYYLDNYLIPAKYVNGKKVAGRRSHTVAKYELKTLRTLIPDSTRLRDIDFEFCRRLRLRLIDLPVTIDKWVPKARMSRGKMRTIKRGEKVKVHRQRSITDVNRHMELLRHMMKVACNRLRWVHHDPFANAPEPLIVRSDEKKRRRIMSFEEEEAILAQCVEPRAHMRLVVIGLVDSCMRSGEFFKLRVGDLGFDPRNVTVQQLNTKTLVERSAPMSARFARELKARCDELELDPSDRLFDFAGVRRAWATAKRLAGVSDLRLKDLRRTGATRLLRWGMPIEEISHILGHTEISMTYEYIGVDRNTTMRAVEIQDANHREREGSELVH